MKNSKMQMPKLIEQVNYKQRVVSLWENVRNPLAKCNCNAVNLKESVKYFV